MLSYRHSFHAGNFADVLKHVVLVDILEYFNKKESAFDYIDTHSGAGLFNLQSAHAQKIAEHVHGIDKLNTSELPELTTYFDIIKRLNPEDGGRFYPGSPFFAQQFIRAQDRAWLYELHPEDHKLLCKNMLKHKRIRIHNEDGLKGLLALLPPVSRRAMVLVDPSYEIKSEYEQVGECIQKAYKKFPTGTYAIWYPVVERKKIELFERQFMRSGIKNIQRFELGVRVDSTERGMTSSGMIVINPPWTLFNNMSALLPKLARALTTEDKPFFKCDVLCSE